MTSQPCCDQIHDVQHFSPTEVAARISAAKVDCTRRGVRFTPLRQQIYQLILESTAPIGAYDLITQLQQLRCSTGATNQTKNVAPPTVYRSLEFLLAENLIHQLTSLNAYVPCCHPRDKHTAAFLICESCQRVQECSSLPVQEMMSFAKDDAGFLVARSVIELAGRCKDCQ
ncbi:transcriptional repressor [Psychrobacter ciconiae]|uniref:transcriptional repressor n=1 Tax=Psychrobacter ciconiae TaxID=1553449 RepID=UPI001918AF6B|nr:transcriptional repressor [Psychrobacter ciconiae]